MGRHPESGCRGCHGRVLPRAGAHLRGRGVEWRQDGTALDKFVRRQVCHNRKGLVLSSGAAANAQDAVPRARLDAPEARLLVRTCALARARKYLPSCSALRD
jgi:hypothetical protein